MGAALRNNGHEVPAITLDLERHLRREISAVCDAQDLMRQAQAEPLPLFAAGMDVTRLRDCLLAGAEQALQQAFTDLGSAVYCLLRERLGDYLNDHCDRVAETVSIALGSQRVRQRGLKELCAAAAAQVMYDKARRLSKESFPGSPVHEGLILRKHVVEGAAHARTEALRELGWAVYITYKIMRRAAEEG